LIRNSVALEAADHRVKNDIENRLRKFVRKGAWPDPQFGAIREDSLTISRRAAFAWLFRFSDMRESHAAGRAAMPRKEASSPRQRGRIPQSLKRRIAFA
jgi:hypothetical protein